ncbi:unnamed protein product [Calypogeia fissa]
MGTKCSSEGRSMAVDGIPVMALLLRLLCTSTFLIFKSLDLRQGLRHCGDNIGLFKCAQVYNKTHIYRE